MSSEGGPREAADLGARRELQAWLSGGVGVAHLPERKGWVVAAIERGWAWGEGWCHRNCPAVLEPEGPPTNRVYTT